jgi:hypothetical protein
LANFLRERSAVAAKILFPTEWNIPTDLPNPAAKFGSKTFQEIKCVLAARNATPR